MYIWKLKMDIKHNEKFQLEDVKYFIAQIWTNSTVVRFHGKILLAR